MDKQPIHGKSRFKRFINGRGFYGVLAACLLAVGGLSVATFGEALFVKEPAESSQPNGEHQAVEQPVNNEPDTRKTTTTTTTKAPTTTTTAVPAADLYVLPMGNTVHKAYSAGEPVYSLTMGDWRVHTGVDFAGETGQEVKALADGKVTAVDSDPFWGQRLTIDHGMGVLSYYSGVKPQVAIGDTVKVGQTIGILEDIPCETAQGPHLHLEMTVDGRSVDPVHALGREVRYAEGAEGIQKTE